jgi:hypothetical protein
VWAQRSRDRPSDEAHRRAVIVQKPQPSGGDELVEHHKDRECRGRQQQLAFPAQDPAQLAETRYRGGAASYREALSKETNYLNAARAQSGEFVALVEIYQTGEAVGKSKTWPGLN